MYVRYKINSSIIWAEMFQNFIVVRSLRVLLCVYMFAIDFSTS